MIFPSLKVSIQGKEKIKSGKPYVIVSNHQSMIDIIILFRISYFLLWVSKKENFHVPVLGQVMWLNGYVYLDRNNPRTFQKMYENCANILKRNMPLMVFPEGTRSKDGNLGRFKDGAFKMAIDNKVSIIPVVLDGASSILPKKGFIIQGHHPVTIKVLDEITYESFNTDNPSVLKETVRNVIASELEKIRQQNKS
jgi:1-acyl-sn-glycerol-3-phosphate acyltransferase